MQRCETPSVGDDARPRGKGDEMVREAQFAPEDERKPEVGRIARKSACSERIIVENRCGAMAPSKAKHK